MRSCPALMHPALDTIPVILSMHNHSALDTVLVICIITVHFMIFMISLHFIICIIGLHYFVSVLTRSVQVTGSGDGSGGMAPCEASLVELCVFNQAG